MKFKEFLKEAEKSALEKFLEPYGIDAVDDNRHIIESMEELLDATGEKIRFDITSLHLLNDHGGSKIFNPPIGSDDWVNLRDFGFIGGHNDQLHIIEDFSKMPNVATLSFSATEIKSFAKGNHLSEVKYLDFRFVEKVECGLLSMFKMPNLHGLELKDLDGANEELMKALEIVNKHLEGERDLTECMDELIEAGLKKYAKL